ncbi:hypothetical protein MMC11_006913 [Xylographa trunciseda]|nr:hypothetical protein [Xylographa trunciseda]
MEASLESHNLNRQRQSPAPQYSPQSDGASYAEPLTPNSASGSDHEMDSISGHEDLERTFELKTIAPLQQHFNSQDHSTIDGDIEHRSSFEEEAAMRQGHGRKESFMLYTPDEEHNVLKKLDKRLVLFVAILYMLSFLDRSNIGNAKIAGLSEDLQLSSSQYQWLLTAFYITYILFEWMTLLYRVVPPHIYIALCVASWGLVASLQSVADSFTSMLVLRALLGVGEAAFGPGVPFYLSFFYKREELALRTGLFISAAPLATSFASTLAWLITKAAAKIPIAAWRLLFLVEGFPSMIVAVFVWHYMPDSPGTAKFLTQRQKKVARLRLRKEKDTKQEFSEKSGLKMKEILQTLADPKCYITAAMFFSCNVAFSSLPPFLPTILKEMGYTALTSQALSAPPYLFSFFVVLLVAYLSDRYRSRNFYVCLSAIMGTVGYAIIAIAGWRRASAGWRYAGVYAASAGFFSAITIIITWTINNQDSDSKKGTGMVMLNIIGQLGPLLGTRLYPDSDRPYYVKGMSVCAGFMFLVFALSLILRTILARENAKSRIAYSRIEGEDDEEGGLGMEDDGEVNPERFMYIL